MTHYDRTMLRVMNDPRGRALHATAARRRLAVSAHVALTVAIGGLITHFWYEEAEPTWAAVAVVLLLLPWVIATGVINSAIRGLLELRRHVLDERQSAERSRVVARAHRVMAVLLGVAVVGLLAGGVTERDAVQAYAAPVLIAVLVVHLLMPLWVAGLTARDEPTEDEAAAV
ncbi:hypothetical protein GCM10027074_25540 [Streptomyces deserti]